MAFFNRFLDNFGEGVASGIQRGAAQQQQIDASQQASTEAQAISGAGPLGIEERVATAPEMEGAIREGAATTAVEKTQSPFSDLENSSSDADRYIDNTSFLGTPEESLPKMLQTLTTLQQNAGKAKNIHSNFTATPTELGTADPRQAGFDRGNELIQGSEDRIQKLTERITQRTIKLADKKELDKIVTTAIANGNTEMAGQIMRSMVNSGYYTEQQGMFRQQGLKREGAKAGLNAIDEKNLEARIEYIQSNPILSKDPIYISKMEAMRERNGETIQRTSAKGFIDRGVASGKQSYFWLAQERLNTGQEIDRDGNDPLLEQLQRDLRDFSGQEHEESRDGYDMAVFAGTNDFYKQLADPETQTLYFIINRLDATESDALALAALSGADLNNLESNTQAQTDELIKLLRNPQRPETKRIAREWAVEQAQIAYPGMGEYNRGMEGSSEVDPVDVFFDLAMKERDPVKYLQRISMDGVLSMRQSEGIRKQLINAGLGTELGPDFNMLEIPQDAPIDPEREAATRTAQQANEQSFAEELAEKAKAATPEERSRVISDGLMLFLKSETKVDPSTGKSYTAPGAGVRMVGILGKLLGGGEVLTDVSLQPPVAPPTAQEKLETIQNAPSSEVRNRLPNALGEIAGKAGGVGSSIRRPSEDSVEKTLESNRKRLKIQQSVTGGGK